MVVFSCIAEAIKAGFTWLEYSSEYGLHVVQLDRPTPRGRVRALAFARPTEAEAATRRTAPSPEGRERA